MHVNQARAAGPAEAKSGSRVRVPLLGALLERTDSRERCVWLDLGPVRDGLVQRLSHRCTRLLVADLTEARAQGRKDWYRPDSVLTEPVWSEPADIILAWDLLNYANVDQLGRMSAQLSEHAADGCQMHALIRYSSPTMPAQPADCRLAQGNELELIDVSSSVDPAPRFSPRALEKAMPAFRVEQTVLLNNGMQEFLLSHR